MKILVTGAAGFIGSHLVERCLREGHAVRAFVHYNSDGRWGWLDQLPEPGSLDVVSGDIRDFDSVTRALVGCDAVMHLAALIGIPYSYTSPLAYIRTNVEGTYNVLEAARRQELSKVLITSTSETYGSAQYVPMDEAHPAVGQSPYAATKIAADQLGISYFRSFGLPVRIARPFNTYGPRQSARAIIPSVMSQVIAGKRQISAGSLTPLRDLTYVGDTVDGLLAILGSDELIGQATNIGSNQEISIGDLIATIGEVMGVNIDVLQSPERVRPDASEVVRLRCDNRRIIASTGWRPSVSLKEGLAKTAEWLAHHGGAYRSSHYNV